MSRESKGADEAVGGVPERVPAQFGERWLAMVGASPDTVVERAERARERAARYPRTVRLARRAVLLALNWFAPLFWLGIWSRAVHLDRKSFGRLMRKIREHRRPFVRMAGLAVVAPLMEAIESEEELPAAPAHPLEEAVSEHKSGFRRDEYDVLVIGSGAGGAPVAARLAERGADVAVVEKGRLVEAASTSAALERYYVNQGLFGVARGTPIVVMAGETLGGTTSVNSGTSLRPLPECLEKWDAQLGTNFAGGELDPWLERAREAINVHVPAEELRSTSARVVAEGFDAIGRNDHYGLPRCVDGCKGSGRCCFGCPTGAKQSTDRAFLPRAHAAGADLYVGWEAHGIHERRSGVEVEIRGAEGERRLRASQVVVSAGALASPALIRSNRLGSHWIHAGRRFKTHPATKIFAYVPGIERPDANPGIPQGLGYRPPELERVTMEGAELPTSAVGPLIAAGGERFRRWLGRHEQLVSYGAMVRDRNHGRLESVFGQPVLSYEMHPEDAADLVRALQLIGEAFFAAGAQRVLLPWPGFDNEFESVGDLQAVDPGGIEPSQLLLSGFHPQGTAGMGRLVDSELRLRGSERISVCDASVLPDSPGVNPQVTIMALSLRLAERLEGE